LNKFGIKRVALDYMEKRSELFSNLTSPSAPLLKERGAKPSYSSPSPLRRGLG
jgi:hypothetical protein